MPALSINELGAAEEQLQYEYTLAMKYRAFASQCSDVALKEKCSQIAKRHQERYHTLLHHM